MTRPLRVLEVSQRYFPELGGTETHMHEVSRRLARRPEFDITVFATDRSGELPRRERGDGFDVIRRRAWPKNRDYYLCPGLVRVIRRGDWDLIHFQGIHTFVPIIGMLAARSAQIPYVLTFHTGGHSSEARSSMRDKQWRLLAPLLGRAEALVAVSRFERRLFEKATGIDAARFSVIRNGGSLPPVDASTAVTPGRIVSSGRLERYKGHHRLIEALPLVRQTRPDAHVVILGAGPYEAELLALAAHLDVAESVAIRHIPPGDRAAMTRELAAAEVLAALSDYEAHPVGVMEALTLGISVVGFDIAGIADLVEDGLVSGLDPTSSPRGVADALLAEMGAPPKPVAVDLPTWDDSADALADLYLRVTGQPKEPRPPVVVHVTTTLTTGGAERQVQYLAEGQPSAQVLCLYRSGPVGDALTAAGIPVHVLGMSGWRKPLAHLRLARWLRQLRPDVVHAHMLSAQLWGVPAARLARVPVVVSTEHSIMEKTIEDRPKNRWLQGLYLLLERMSDQTIAVSPVTAERLEAWRVPAGRITVVANAVDTERVVFDPEERRAVRAQLGVTGQHMVIGVGRLVPAKRFDVLLRALAPALATGSTVLVIVGDGPERDRLAGLAAQLGVAQAVHLTGAKADIGPWLSAADVLASPSRDETFGLAVVEGLLSGLPVVYAQCPALDGLALPTATQLHSSGDSSTELAELAITVADARGADDRRAPEELLDRYSLQALHRGVEAVYAAALSRMGGRRRR